MVSQEEGRQLLEDVKDFLKKKEFTKAVELFGTFKKDIKKCSSKKEFKNLGQEVALIIRVNEAYKFAVQKDVVRLKEKMDEIKESSFELLNEEKTEELQSILDYVDRHYKFFLEIYTYKLKIKDFNKAFQGVEHSFEKKNFKLGLKKYTELFIAYNELAHTMDNEKKLSVYSKARGLFKGLKIQRLFHFAVEKPKHVEVKGKLVYPHINPAMFSHEVKNPIQTNKSVVSADFEKLRKLIEENKVHAAQKLYEDL